jgi:hypothetical protein
VRGTAVARENRTAELANADEAVAWTVTSGV